MPLNRKCTLFEQVKRSGARWDDDIVPGQRPVLLRKCMSTVRIQIVFVALVLLWSIPATAQDKRPVEDFRANMNEVYDAFTRLQPYLFDQRKFLDPKDEATIASLLTTMNTKFHRAESVQGRYGKDPGFASTLAMTQEMLADSLSRFKEGNKGYALWRLKSSSTYCTSCHTRMEVASDFFRGSEKALQTLDRYEQADFYFATRQFDKASHLFLVVAEDPAFSFVKMDALRKWLVIYTRVHPSPELAITELERLHKIVQFSPYEEEEIEGWLTSLKEWSQEKGESPDPVKKAERLIARATDGDPASARGGTVELLRATAMLHKIEEGPSEELRQQRSHVLYLLGLAYSEIPYLFVNELPEMFLEQCIRDFPGTVDAKKAFEQYQRVIELSYTGSGGMSLPEDIAAKLVDLRKIAQGEKS